MEEKTKFQDILKEGETGVKVNFTRLNQAIKKCEEDKLNKQCRIMFKDLGVDII